MAKQSMDKIIENSCRILKFTEPMADNALRNHVIQLVQVNDKDQCELLCYLEQMCLSFNFGSGNCELSNSDHYQHPEDLASRIGFSYHPTAILCSGLLCPPASSCLPNHQGNLRCVCPADWPNATNCERDADECSLETHDCSADAYCNDTVGSFKCTCRTGFTGDGRKCRNVDECSLGKHNCSADAFCNDNLGSFTCTCVLGFSGDGRTCQNVNECTLGTHNCSTDAFCFDTVGSYNCTCRTGFTGDGRTCQTTNECVAENNSCHEDAVCTDTEDGYNCTCSQDMIGNGSLCLGFPFYWTLNGSDPFISLYNGATYKSINGTTALYLDGRSYAETPALPIQTTSFSILCWMKVLNLPADVINIYSDWSSPHQFRFGMIQDSLCANLRRDFPKSSNIVYFCGGHIHMDKWMHVAFTWSREGLLGRLYIDGFEEGKQRVLGSTINLDLNPTGHSVFDIGLKRDSLFQHTFHGFLRNLMVFDVAITGLEVKKIFTDGYTAA
nr:low-density lipoprotein receptor-related protein 2-like [Pocillopora verrucosa]